MCDGYNKKLFYWFSCSILFEHLLRFVHDQGNKLNQRFVNTTEVHMKVYERYRRVIKDLQI